MSDPRWFLGHETGKVVDQLIDDYLPKHCMGLNDMGVVSGLMTTAAMLIGTHCDRKPEDSFDELLALAHDILETAGRVVKGRP